MGSGGVAEVPTICYPKRSRAPSIVPSDDHLNNGSNAAQIAHNAGCEQPPCSMGCVENPSCRPLYTTAGSNGNGNAMENGGGDGSGVHNQGQRRSVCLVNNAPTAIYPTRRAQNKLATCYSLIFSKAAKKIYFGICVTLCVTTCWVGATHCVKFLYKYEENSTIIVSTNGSSIKQLVLRQYRAPFFTTWFCTNWAVFYFPMYFISQVAKNRCNSPSEIIAESLRGFRDKGFTGGRFLTRCSLFCGLWVSTNYMYIHSLRILFATEVMALFATNVACVYLLSWVFLHEQFVGIRIVAVILCDTGIALLAYMDGITGSPTFGGVVLAASAAAGSAVYKVLFRKIMGDTTFGQLSLFFSLIGICNAALLWPVCLALYFSGAETVHLARLPWAALLLASVLHLAANMLGSFSVELTYDLFITLGLITAVPVSAAIDTFFYGAHFAGMKLAGIILIAVGFFLVMFPDNWPDYITRVLRNVINVSYTASTMKLRRGGCGGRDVRRRHSFQHRHFRRNYGVSSAHGDGQTLLPTSTTNQPTATTTTITTTSSATATTATKITTNHRHNPDSSSPDNNPRRVLTSNFTTSTNNHNYRPHAVPRAKQDGVGDTGMALLTTHRAK